MRRAWAKEDLMIDHLRVNQVHIWKAKTTDAKLVEECYSVLLPEEQKRSENFKFEHARQQYIVSQGVLRVLIGLYLGIAPEKVKIGRHNKGKPYSLDDPGLFFNTSNSGGLCVYAFSRDGEVGIDIEKKRELPDLQELISKNFTESEIDYIKRNLGEESDRFFRFWTIKESYLKAIGEGMRLTPDNLEFRIDQGRVKLVSIKGIFDFEDWILQEFEPAPDFVGTVVYQTPDCEISEKWYAGININ